MKKMIIIGMLAVSAVGFAAGKNNGTKEMNFKRNQNIASNLTLEQREAFAKERIAMDEKKLEIRKLMVSQNPDWNKVEKTNLELATMRAKSQTQKMKLRHETMLKNQATKTN